MKKLLLALGCVALLAMPANAEMQGFSRVKLDVPSGWTATEDNGVVAVVAPGNAATLKVAFSSNEGLSAEFLATQMSKSLQGSTPVEQDGLMVFEFTRNGELNTSYLGAYDDKFVLFTVTDPSGSFNNTIWEIIESVDEN